MEGQAVMGFNTVMNSPDGAASAKALRAKSPEFSSA